MSNLHTTGHASHLDSRAGDTSIALSVVFVNVDTFVFNLRGWVHVGTLIQFLSLSSVALVLDLGSKFTADELLALWGDLLGELKGSKPVLKIHSHVKSKLWLCATQEALLSCVRLE